MQRERHGRRHAELRSLQQDVAVPRQCRYVRDGVGPTRCCALSSSEWRGTAGLRAGRDTHGVRQERDGRDERSSLRYLAAAAVGSGFRFRLIAQNNNKLYLNTSSRVQLCSIVFTVFYKIIMSHNFAVFGRVNSLKCDTYCCYIVSYLKIF